MTEGSMKVPRTFSRKLFGMATSMLMAGLLATSASVARADDAQEASKLVQQAKLTVDSFATDTEIGRPFRDPGWPQSAGSIRCVWPRRPSAAWLSA
jgi:hypothetical protein